MSLRQPYAVNRGMFALQPVLNDDEAARRTWSALDEPERRAVARWAGRPMSIKTRRERLQQVCWDLRQGPEIVRAKLPHAS